MVYGKKVIGQSDLDPILQKFKGRKLKDATREALEKPITDKEIEGVMERLPWGKSAGPDRLPNAIYSTNPSLLAPLLGKVIREA